MRLSLIGVLVGVLFVLWAGAASGDSPARPPTGLKPDLPLEFPVPRGADPYKQPSDLEDGKEAKNPGQEVGKGGQSQTPGTVSGSDKSQTPGMVSGEDKSQTPGTVNEGEKAQAPGQEEKAAAPTEESKAAPPTEEGKAAAPTEEATTAPRPTEGPAAPSEVERPIGPPVEETTIAPPVEESSTTPPVEESSTTPPVEEGTTTPPEEEEGPRNPPPEFFDEPIEAAEVIYVIDCTGSMSWASNMSVVDVNGAVHNNASKMKVAKIELVKSISNLGENVKLAIVAYATNIGTPTWPLQKTLMVATPANKASAMSWANGMPMGGYTNTGDAMSVALKMVTPPSPGKGPGGETKKSPTSLYLLTDGLPNRLRGQAFTSTSRECMELTKATILSENVHIATIYTLGIGLARRQTVDLQAYQWCLEFLTSVAEATGGHFREVAK